MCADGCLWQARGAPAEAVLLLEQRHAARSFRGQRRCHQVRILDHPLPAAIELEFCPLFLPFYWGVTLCCLSASTFADSFRSRTSAPLVAIHALFTCAQRDGQAHSRDDRPPVDAPRYLLLLWLSLVAGCAGPAVLCARATSLALPWAASFIARDLIATVRVCPFAQWMPSVCGLRLSRRPGLCCRLTPRLPVASPSGARFAFQLPAG